MPQRKPKFCLVVSVFGAKGDFTKAQGQDLWTERAAAERTPV